MKARIGVVDDHPATLLGVTAILNAHPGLHVVATAATTTALLRSESRFDVILLDLQLADGSTPAANVAALAHTGAPVLAYTGGDQPRLVREAARAGVVGMIRKSELPGSLVRAVVAALRGELAVTADWASAIDEDQEFVSAQLTDREAQVLALYASGETAERVGAILFVSRDTVLDHIRRIRAKYAAVGRAAPTKVDLFRRAIEDGLVESSG
jgi:DNA-binding NarL/FixJ family response regulator